MKKILLILAVAFSINTINAQFIQNKSISAQIGYGLSSTYDSAQSFVDGGFYAQGELILEVASWIDLRPYAGVVFTSSDGEDLNGNPTTETATTNAFLFGGKARVRAPFRWVAPYFEIGIGASVGKFETLTIFDNISQSGFIYHIPFSLGLELGRNNNFDFGFTYYVQPTVRQFAGAVAVGVTFPLD